MLDLIAARVASLTFMHVALILGGLFILALLVIAQRANDNFDLRHLIADGDKVNRYSFAFMLGCVVLTWAFVYYAEDHRLDMWDFAIYGLLMMFPEVVRSSLGPVIAARFGARLPPPTNGG
jgi:uncharacterized membrane protein YedE/YeeE